MASTGTGVVIGSHSVKVVQARRKGGVLRLTRVANLKLDAAAAERPLDARKIDKLGGLIADAEIRPGEAMLGLTGRDLIVRYTHVPPVPDWRLGMLMKFEIEEVSEQSGGEVSADWWSLELDDIGSAEKTVLVALAKNAALTPRIDVLNRANLRLRGACPNAIAAHHAFVTTAHYEPGEVTMIMHIGAENTDIAIQQDGRLIFARNVSGGGSLFTEAIMNQFGAPYDRAEKMKRQKVDVTPKSSAKYEDSLAEKVSNAVLGVTGQFVSMVHSSVMFAKAQTKQKDLSVDRVVLSGGGATLRGFREYMENNVGMPVAVYDPTKAVDISGLPPDQAAVFDRDPTGLTVAIGLASMGLDRAAAAVEIMPEEYRKRRNFMERGAWMIGAAAVTALLIIILFVSSGRDHGAVAEEESKQQGVEFSARSRIGDLGTAKNQWRASRGKWAALREEVQSGPALLMALGWMKGVVLDEEFRSIHITRVKCNQFDVPRPTLPWDPDEEPGMKDGDRDQRTVRAVSVQFEAEISELAARPAAVFERFGSRLGALLRQQGDDLLRDELDLTKEELNLGEEEVADVKKNIGRGKIEDEDVKMLLRKISANLPTFWLDGPSPGRNNRELKFQILFAYLDR